MNSAQLRNLKRITALRLQTELAQVAKDRAELARLSRELESLKQPVRMPDDQGAAGFLNMVFVGASLQNWMAWRAGERRKIEHSIASAQQRLEKARAKAATALGRDRVIEQLACSKETEERKNAQRRAEASGR